MRSVILFYTRIQPGGGGQCKTIKAYITHKRADGKGGGEA